MSRSYYSEDCENLELWRGAVASAIRGKRGQALLREMRDALDAMPEKKLIARELIAQDGAVCALGAVAVKRNQDMSKVDPEEPDEVAAAFNVSKALVQEIAWMNDEYLPGISPEERWKRMRKWVEENIRPLDPLPIGGRI